MIAGSRDLSEIGLCYPETTLCRCAAVVSHAFIIPIVLYENYSVICVVVGEYFLMYVHIVHRDGSIKRLLV